MGKWGWALLFFGTLAIAIYLMRRAPAFPEKVAPAKVENHKASPTETTEKPAENVGEATSPLSGEIRPHEATTPPPPTNPVPTLNPNPNYYEPPRYEPPPPPPQYTEPVEPFNPPPPPPFEPPQDMELPEGIPPPPPPPQPFPEEEFD